MSQSSVPFTAGPPETVLSAAPSALSDALAAASALRGPERRSALAAVAAGSPRFLDVWARLAETAMEEGQTVEAYAYARVGYHRGLDTLRAEGWRGSGYVRWAHATNRGFLASLEALRAAAAAIGEVDEERRCEVFLAQLDPDLKANHPLPGATD